MLASCALDLIANAKQSTRMVRLWTYECAQPLVFTDTYQIFRIYTGSVLMEQTIPQNFELDPSFYFMSKNRKPFAIFCKMFF